MAKYLNRKIKYEGFEFDSKKEANRFKELELLERGKEIYNLQTQVKFLLIPSQKVDGRVVERPTYYIADFVYHKASDDEMVVEDVKSPATRKLPCYVMKRKLMLKEHGLQVQEI